MRALFRNSLVVLAIAIATFGLNVQVAEAEDGQEMINQKKAMKGNVTPDDTAGFPVTISQPGSYKLSGNLTVPDIDTTAVEITADNVTLDLNGFGIFGPWAGGEQGDGNGIYALQSNITVINGSVRGMGLAGIFLDGNSHRVERVHATANGVWGFHVGNASLVKDNIANSNNGHGFVILPGSTVAGNTANFNGYQSFGMLVSCPSTVIGNTIVNNYAENLYLDGSSCTDAHNTAPALDPN